MASLCEFFPKHC